MRSGSRKLSAKSGMTSSQVVPLYFCVEGVRDVRDLVMAVMLAAGPLVA
jgi:hypothetical protein